MSHTLFTSESVTRGHPDKVCDQISDAVLDACLSQDPNSRVACETLTATGLVMIAGEITTNAVLDYQEIIRATIKNIGYDDPQLGFDYESCAVISAINKQSPDISQGVSEGQGLFKEMGAGDQGMMFGYACSETKELMPMPIMLAHKLTAELTRLREMKELPYLKPDGKAQVTVEYDEDNNPVRVDTVVLSTQHTADIAHIVIVSDMKRVIRSIVPSHLIDSKTKFYINPTGRFVIGGPKGDSGLTGRKIIVDTYGGMGKHGGGAFSGKDATKVDRSASYAARYAAKNIVAAGLAKMCEVQLAYAIGVSHPVSIKVDTKHTGIFSDKQLAKAVEKVFDFRPAKIIEILQLNRPIYSKTSFGGHFGRDEDTFTWEKTDKVEELKAELGIDV